MTISSLNLDSTAYGGSGSSPPDHDHDRRRTADINLTNKKAPRVGGSQVHRMIAPQVPGLPCSHLTVEGAFLLISIMAQTPPGVMGIYAQFYVTNCEVSHVPILVKFCNEMSGTCALWVELLKYR